MSTFIQSAGAFSLLAAAAFVFPALGEDTAPAKRTTQSFGELSQISFLSGTQVASSDRMAFGTCLDEIDATAISTNMPARIVIDTGDKRIVQFGSAENGGSAVFVTCDLTNMRRIVNVSRDHRLADGTV